MGRLSWWTLNIVTRALIRERQEIWLQMGEGGKWASDGREGS